MTDKKEFLSFDWLTRILMGIVAFFLIGIFVTVQKTAGDVSDLKATIKVLQYRYSDLDTRLKKIESLK